MIHFLVPAAQTRGIKDYLDVFGAPLVLVPSEDRGQRLQIESHSAAKRVGLEVAYPIDREILIVFDAMGVRHEQPHSRAQAPVRAELHALPEIRSEPVGLGP